MTRPLDGTGLKRLHRQWRRRVGGRLALVLDSVASPFNVGAIVRSAAAWRVDHLWVAGETPSPASPKVGRTALGCERYLTWTVAEEVGAALAAARREGYRLVALELAEGARPLHEMDLRGDVCLVAGHEDRGLRPATLERCDAVAYVPLLGRVGSLNVATAVSVACYEVRRQTWTHTDGARRP